MRTSAWSLFVDICLLSGLCERDTRLCFREGLETGQQTGGWGGGEHGALAFCFNDCRSLLPLLPVIAF